MNKYILQGAGGHAAVVLECLIEMKIEVAGIFDPNASGNIFEIPIFGKYDASVEKDSLAIIAIGDNFLRKKVAISTKHKFGNAVHPSSQVSRFSNTGVGNMILNNSIVQARTEVGDHVILNTASQVDHDCTIENFVHIAPGAVLCGNVKIGEGSLIGAGSVILPGVNIGKWCTIAAGSVVFKDVPDNAVVIGNPSRIIKYNSEKDQ